MLKKHKHKDNYTVQEAPVRSESPIEQTIVDEMKENPAPQQTELRIEQEEAGLQTDNLVRELDEQKDKYLRLYAEFENYKKRVQKDKGELINYGNESLLYELLPVIDNLEMALKHSVNNAEGASGRASQRTGLIQGVEITLKEFLKVFERFGVVAIDSIGKKFDPSVHHAMSQVEKDDIEENTVVEEFRKGYMLKDKILRPSLVAVSKKTESAQEPAASEKTDEADEMKNQNNINEEE